MRKIFCIGEALFDIIFKNGLPKAGKPGGAMLNSTISLGRIGLPVYLITEYGNDDLGKLIEKFLNDNGVITKYANHFDEGKTAIAVAFLNKENEASYSFYKNYPSQRLNFGFPRIHKNDIILYGSYYAISLEIRNRFKVFLKAAKENGALTIYDPNFRRPHLPELPEKISLIIENMQLASLVRGSSEDFKYVFGTSTPDETWNVVKEYCKCLVYTASHEGVYVRTSGFSGKFPVKKIIPISTIGAGDNFNAGMIASIYKNEVRESVLVTMGEEQWSGIVALGVEFATDVCLSYDNYVSFEFAGKLKINNF